MSASVQPIPSGDQIMANVNALRSQGASDDDVEAYLNQSGLQPDPSPASQQIHADYRSGALGQRMAAANASDAQDAQGPDYVSRFVTHLLKTAQGLPGMGVVEAGAGALGSHLTGHPMSYAQSYDTLHGMTDQVGGWTGAAENMMGSLPLMPFLPGNPAAAGALLGGADQALNADPNESTAARVGSTVAGAGVGGLLGKGMDALVTGGRALMTPNTSTQLLAKSAERAAGAKALYSAALASGQGKAFPPQLSSYMQEPDIASIVDALQSTTHKGVPTESPEMLDAVYKTLSDQAKAAQKGLEQVDPSKPNLGRFRLEHLKNLKSGLLDAMSQPGTVPGKTFGTGPSVAPPTDVPAVMPAYEDAVGYFARLSRELDATGQGNDVLKNALSKTIPSARVAQKKTPEVFGDWLHGLTMPADRTAAANGVLGGVKAGLQRAPLTTGRRALFAGSGLLRAVNPNAGNPALGGLLAVHSLLNR